MVTLKQEGYLDKARRSREFAVQELKSLRSKTITATELDRHWTNFVTHWENSLKFLILASDPGNTTRIAADIRQDRASDPVLQYVFQARNSEYHGGKIVEATPSKVTYGKLARGSMISIIGDGPMNVIMEDNFLEGSRLSNAYGKFESGTFEGHMDNPSDFEMSGPKFELVDVDNRGQRYTVPNMNVSPAELPFEIARYCINYLNAKICLVEERFQDT